MGTAFGSCIEGQGMMHLTEGDSIAKGGRNRAVGVGVKV